MHPLDRPDFRSNLPAVPDQPAVYPLQPGYGYYYDAPEPAETGTPLSHYLWIVRRQFWKVFAFVCVSVAATVIISSRLTPIYESTVTVDVDRRAPTGILGQESQVATGNDADQFLATQVRLIQSDSVLRPVVQKFNPEPCKGESGSEALPTAAQQDAPVMLKKLKVLRPSNTYLLQISYRNPDRRTAAAVANAVAQSYIMHSYNLRISASTGLASFMEKQLEELKAKMEQSSASLAAFEKELNVINPEEKTSILSARLQQLNTEFTNSQADRIRKEAAYNSVQSGAMEAAEVSAQGDSIRKLTERRDEANEKFAQIKTHFGANHPEYRKTASQVAELQRQVDQMREQIGKRANVEFEQTVNREKMLQKAVAQTKAEFDKLNSRSFEYRALKQEADADKKLYEELIRKIKEAGINAGFQNSSIRLADTARPSLLPVFPDIPLNAGLAFLFSTLIAVGAAVLSDVLDNTLRDPEQIKQLNTQLIGSLPSVRVWHRKAFQESIAGVSGNGAEPGERKHLGDGSKNGSKRAFAAANGFEEAIRTLRDSILLSDLQRPIRSLMITSATPREGKTTTSCHLARAHASQRRTTLLIDCDLRRPGVHGTLGIANGRGMSDVINDEAPWRECLVTAPDNPHLSILTAGSPSRRAADRLGQALEEILDDAMKDFDLIIVDTPPLLGFAEPLQMAALTDGVVVVTKAGQTARAAVQSVLQALNRLKVNVVGLVLNEVNQHMSDRYYYYGYYGKYYSKYYKALKS